MDACETEVRTERFNPLVETLRLAKVPAVPLLKQAENFGLTPEEMVREARRFVTCEHPEAQRLAALCLVFGTVCNWQPLLGALLPHASLISGCFFNRLRSRDEADPRLAGLEALRDLVEDSYRFGFRVLRRLGWPGSHRGWATMPRSLEWLDQGRDLLGIRLDLNGGVSRAEAWGDLLVDELHLRDCRVPPRLRWTEGHGYYGGGSRSLRLFRVQGLREVFGGDTPDIRVVAVDCPTLERVPGPAEVLVLKDCPRVREVFLPETVALLHLECCHGLRSFDTGDRGTLVCRTVVLADCRNLKVLPAYFHVEKSMTLRRVAGFDRWPTHLWVRGSLRIQDCPDMETLPPVEVGGDLVISGASGLRALSPGSIIGGHLDLRACNHLKAIPRGVQVGGNLYLPPHLAVRASVPTMVPSDPLLEMPRDRYPELHDLLKSLRFQELCLQQDWIALREEGEAILLRLRRELLENPRVLSELLWTASEAWRDLSEERWERDREWGFHWDRPEEDFPSAWFQGLLMGAEAA
ncbi:hypothetical protein [Holophaga foetida]|uniref:hypothetical protein n=1 Tax=Holophaga foetida TaxID=35839 RepID=UPI0002471C56|nr:hypothetical protein [Holophaga foetida]